jgi:DMSO/TMAO reductase YedYZ molybdopterin-dependent catalytic subunit
LHRSTNATPCSLSLGALTLLVGCDVSENVQLQTMLHAVSDWNDRVQAFIFRPDHLAPTYSEAQVVKPPRFNAHYDAEDVKPVDGATWKLELSGLIEDRQPWTVERLYELQEMIIKHICVEGWDYIGQWSGVNLRAFLERIGADTTASTSLFAAPLTTPKAWTWRQRCIHKLCWQTNTPRNRSRIRSVSRCAYELQPSSASRTTNE